MIHPGALTVSAALAIGESRSIDGATFLAAVVAGCEVGARVGRAVGTTHFLSGYHPQGTVGVFAAAAAAARAMGAPAQVVHEALGIAGSHASGLMAAQRGAMVKRLHSGHAAESGVRAALLGSRGFTGIDDVLEADFGGFCSTMGGGSVDLDRLTAGLGTVWETDQVAFKPYPSCAAAQASIEAARLVRLAHSLQPSEIERVVLTTSSHVHTHSGWRYRPEGTTAAQMSIGYGVARMLLEGSLEARHFDDACLADDDLLALTERIDVVPDGAIDSLGPDRRYVARIDVTTDDGRILHLDIDDRPGNTSNPLPADQIVQKFRSLAEPAVGHDAARRIEALVDDLDSLPDVAALAAELRSPAEVTA
jgi:2-methylcitrate dehydratase PrpD